MKKTALLFLLSVTLLPQKALSQELLEDVVIEILLYISYYAIVGNYSAEDHLYNDLTNYPYENSKAGNYSSSDEHKAKYFRVDLANHVMFAGNDVYGDHLDIKVRPFRYFYLQSNFFQTVDFSKATNDPSLSAFTFSFCYDRLRFQKLNLGLTLGINYARSHTSKVKFSGGFNFEWFVTNPVSLHSSVSWGGLNYENFESQVRYHYKRTFVSAGYEMLKVHDPRYHFVTTGLGVYF